MFRGHLYVRAHMAVFLLLIAAVLVCLGVDAFLLSRRSSPPTQIEKDEMMFGKFHPRPIPDLVRSFAQKRYPFSTGASMQFYGWLFVALGLGVGGIALGIW
jgi:hypothetical protein